MAFLSSNAHTYITKWLETATNGKVGAEFSLFNNRMRLRCFECGLSLTSPEPKGTEIDYGVQEFVKLHAHMSGVWKCYKCEQWIDKSLTEHAVECSPVNLKKPIPITADFKPIPGGGKIDLNPEKEAQIKAAADKIDKEYAAKMEPSAIAAKIKALQAGDVGKPIPIGDPSYLKQLTPSKTGFTSGVSMDEDGFGDSPPTDAEVAAMEKAVAAKKAVENVLKIKLLQKQLEDYQNKTIVQHTVPPKAPAGPDAVMVTGRKFR